MSADTISARLRSGTEVIFLVGENGAGKSTLLRLTAQALQRSGRPLLAISNTVYDKFRGLRGFRRVSANWGRFLPEKLLKEAISSASSDDLVRFKAISLTLSYCGYEGVFGLKILFSGKEDRNQFRFTEEWTSFEMQSDSIDVEEIISIADMLNRVSPHQTIWLDFRELGFAASIYREIALVVRHEKSLRKFGLIDGVELCLRRAGIEISVHDASSGQLSTIATLVFLAICARERSVILIDEPENSLHPQWQKEYVSKLMDVLAYKSCQLVIATHAPIVVLGARVSGEVRSETYQVAGAQLRSVGARSSGPPDTSESESVEEILWRSFQTVTPANHFISDELVSAISRVENGEVQAAEVQELVNEFKAASFDHKQKEFLEAVKDLTKEIEVRRDGGVGGVDG